MEAPAPADHEGLLDKQAITDPKNHNAAVAGGTTERKIRAGDTWRNVRAELERVKVVEYDRGDARVFQTTQLQPETTALLRKLGITKPAKLLSVGPIPSEDQPKKRRRLPPGAKTPPRPSNTTSAARSESASSNYGGKFV